MRSTCCVGLSPNPNPNPSERKRGENRCWFACLLRGWMRHKHYSLAMRPVPLLAIALSLACAAAPAAEVVDITWTPTGTFNRELTVAPGKFAEVCGKLPGQAVVAWRFEADAGLDFNVHFHEGKKVEYAAKLTAAVQGDGRLNVAAPQDYCWMWSNKTAQPARLEVSLQR